MQMREDQNIHDVFEKSEKVINSNQDYSMVLKKRMQSTDFEYLSAKSQMKQTFVRWMRVWVSVWILSLVCNWFIQPMIMNNISSTGLSILSADFNALQLVYLFIHGILSLSLFGVIAALVLDLIVTTGYEPNASMKGERA
jgi:hypothetical protein